MRNFFKYCKRKGLLIELGERGSNSYQVRERPGPQAGPLIKPLLNKDLLRAICRRLTIGNPGCCRAFHRNTKTYRPLPTIWAKPLGRLCRINNNSCTEYSRIPRYGHSRSPSEDDYHTILARVGEASTGKDCIHITAYHVCSYPDQLANEGDEWNRESTGRGSTSGDFWNSWSKKSPSDGGRRTLGEIYQQRIPHTNRDAYQKDTPKALRSRSHLPKKTLANPRSLLDERQRPRHCKLVCRHRDKSSILLQVPRQLLPSLNDCGPLDPLVFNIHPDPQTQILGVEYNPKVLQRLKFSQSIRRAWETRIRSRSEQQGALNYWSSLLTRQQDRAKPKQY
ncbi:hypothetical protein M9H77_08256 [Catharanthus roseus]|uniref:Uncharacterized protein n=1 Tax=Catharanthus roseus TaxID=4058 RepID=A0ACC0BXM2_CATRO|nr:hypothetical protein M9H77_08256 [Catharanthus roseus]